MKKRCFLVLLFLGISEVNRETISGLTGFCKNELVNIS